MEGESMTDFGAFAIRQSDPRFRSPGIARKQFGKEALTAHSIKRARRAKSTEPTPLGSHDPFNKYAKKDAVELNADTQLVGEKRLSLSTKIQENMSKTELINSYRLLMSEKLRLERFLSIMSKNHEMARTRLESDLLDAMMCIEDLKQALELRMARRRKIDPREAEERRYLIRQNKKLLNQLYESAKKIERLELTKVEMKEQLELLDFQILEVENQKTMMEEELRRLPSCNNTATQTEDNSNSTAQLILKLQAQIAVMQSDVCSQKAETAAAVARQQHLENLVRDLRRDNVDLRDQLAKLDDAENSLAESDKPLAAGTRLLQAQLEAQVERIRELESKLKATRDYANELESRLRTMQKENQSMEHADEVVSAPLDTASSTQAAMSNGNLNSSGLRVPRVDDLLLQETIRTFQSLITERDQELMQLRRHIRSNLSITESTDQPPLILPQLFESAVQTDLIMAQADKLSGLIDALAEGGILLTAEQNAALTAEIKQSLKVLSENDATGEQPDENGSTDMKRTVGYADLLSNMSKLRQEAERMKMRVALSELALTPDTPVETKASSPVQANEVLVSDQQQDDKQDRVDLTCPEPTRSPNFPTTDSNHEEKLISDSVNLSEGRPLSAPVDPSLNNEPSGTTAHTPKHYRTQLQELKQTGELELARAHLSVSERRRQELERRVLELGEELARARAEARAAETSLSAARRTEAALRRRLLVAMDMQGTDGDLASHRHSTGANFGVAVEAQSTLELQASLIKSEAANASLNEAAQLDRTRLHDQAMRIGQLEAERRALLDRISALQVSEATAQRGIVRLQALYEDMLREYSESRSPELSWRTRDRSRSNYRQTADRDAGGRLPAGAKSMITTMQLQERISELESENLSLKEGLKQLETNKCSVTSQPVGRCSAPACVEVRRLLKAFQERFSDVMGQLTRTQQCLDALQSNSNEPKTETVDSMSEETCLGLITSVQQQLSMLGGALKQHASSGDKLDDSARKLISCSNQLSYLAKWLRGYLKHTDAEILQLRSAILHFQISSVDGEHTITTASSDPDAEHPFSCSIRLNKKLNVDLLSEKEDEIAQLRGRLRDLESQLEVVSAQPEPM